MEQNHHWHLNNSRLQKNESSELCLVGRGDEPAFSLLDLSVKSKSRSTFRCVELKRWLKLLDLLLLPLGELFRLLARCQPRDISDGWHRSWEEDGGESHCGGESLHGLLLRRGFVIGADESRGGFRQGLSERFVGSRVENEVRRDRERHGFSGFGTRWREVWRRSTEELRDESFRFLYKTNRISGGRER